MNMIAGYRLCAVYLKELRNYKRKLFLCPPQKWARAQPTF